MRWRDPIALKGIVKPHHAAYLEITAPEKPGRYPFFSPLPDQKAFGMKGMLVVSGG